MSNDVRTMDGPFGFMFHQVAMYCPDGVQKSVNAYRSLGYDAWSRDTASLVGLLRIDGAWHKSETTANMAFNYQAMPMELEFLKYHGSMHRHVEREKLSRVPFISHMSAHVDDVYAQMELMHAVYNMRPYHLFVTEAHSNPAVKDQKRFVECIFDTRSLIGYDIKCIQRIPWDSDLTAEELLYDAP